MEQEAIFPAAVAVVSIFVDVQGNVVDLSRTVETLVPGDGGIRVLPEAVCLDAMHVQRHQRADKRRFQLVDILTYFMRTRELQTLPAVPNDIAVPSSAAMFHALNRVWFIFRQEVIKKPLGSILKVGKSAKKQVRISQDLPRYKPLLLPRKTIKIHH
jgi:hypothetical protein